MRFSIKIYGRQKGGFSKKKMEVRDFFYCLKYKPNVAIF